MLTDSSVSARVAGMDLLLFFNAMRKIERSRLLTVFAATIISLQ